MLVKKSQEFRVPSDTFHVSHSHVHNSNEYKVAIAAREICTNALSKGAKNLHITNHRIRFDANDNVLETGETIKDYVVFEHDGLPWENEDQLLSSLRCGSYIDGDNSGALGSGMKIAPFRFFNIPESKLVELIVVSKKGNEFIAGRMIFRKKGSRTAEIVDSNQLKDYITKYNDSHDQSNVFIFMRYPWRDSDPKHDNGIINSEAIRLLMFISSTANSLNITYRPHGRILGHFEQRTKENVIVNAIGSKEYNATQAIDNFSSIIQVEHRHEIYTILWNTYFMPGIRRGGHTNFRVNGENLGKSQKHSLRASSFNTFVSGAFSLPEVSNDERVSKDVFYVDYNDYYSELGLRANAEGAGCWANDIDKIKEKFGTQAHFTINEDGTHETENKEDVKYRPFYNHYIYIIPHNNDGASFFHPTSVFDIINNESISNILSKATDELLTGNYQEFNDFKKRMEFWFPEKPQNLPKINHKDIAKIYPKLRLYPTNNGTELKNIQAPLKSNDPMKVFCWSDSANGYINDAITIEGSFGVSLINTTKTKDGRSIYNLTINRVELYKESESIYPNSWDELSSLLNDDWIAVGPKRSIRCKIDEKHYVLSLSINYPTLKPGTKQPNKKPQKKILLEDEVFDSFDPKLKVKESAGLIIFNLNNEKINSSMVSYLRGCDSLTENKFKKYYEDAIRTCLLKKLPEIKRILSKEVYDIPAEYKTNTSYYLNLIIDDFLNFNQGFDSNNKFFKTLKNNCTLIPIAEESCEPCENEEPTNENV